MVGDLISDVGDAEGARAGWGAGLDAIARLPAQRRAAAAMTALADRLDNRLGQ